MPEKVWEANSRLESSYRMIDAPTVQWTEVSVAGTQQKAQVNKLIAKLRDLKIRISGFSLSSRIFLGDALPSSWPPIWL